MLRYFLYLLVTAAVILAGLFIALILVPGRRTPEGNPEYVALGSSFAAGLGLGPRVEGSAVAAGRTINSYPQKFARMSGLSLVDMTWSGSKTRDILHSGMFFQRPQIDGLGPQTKLVTITAGGNDVAYGGDLVMMSYRNRWPMLRVLLGLIANDPLPETQRDFQRVYDDMTSAITEIKRRSPHAKVVVVTYPAVVPMQGTCAALRLTEAQVALMRPVADRLAQVTKDAANYAGASVVDMATISAGHDACSSVPWTQGALTNETPFHPSNAGTDATATALRQLIDESPTGH